MKRIALALAAVALALPLVASARTSAPVIKQKDTRFGNILATRGHKALYFWTVEKKAGGKVRCTGACAAAWPPLLVGTKASVPAKIAGVKGAFATVRRPDGKRQVTYNGLPIYTYAHEGPNQVLCDDVDGWFVLRV